MLRQVDTVAISFINGYCGVMVKRPLIASTLSLHSQALRTLRIVMVVLIDTRGLFPIRLL